MIEIVTFTRKLTNTGKHRITTMRLGNVVAQFHDQNGFTNTSTTKKTNFTTFGIRREKIDNLNACYQNFGFGLLVNIIRGGAVNWIIFL